MKKKVLIALLQQCLTTNPTSLGAGGGHFTFRLAPGLMIFYIHGWHKLEGWIAYLENGLIGGGRFSPDALEHRYKQNAPTHV